MREEELSTVGAQEMDTSAYELSHLKDSEFHWENPQLDMDAVFRLKLTFSSTVSDALLVSSRNTIVLDEENKNSLTTTRVRTSHSAFDVAEKSPFWKESGKWARICF